MTDSNATFKADVRSFLFDMFRANCVQGVDGWIETDCDECEFSIERGCSLWDRRDDLLKRTETEPF